MVNTLTDPGWAHLELWLVNHGWPSIDEIETEDLIYVINGPYAAYQESWEPTLGL